MFGLLLALALSQLQNDADRPDHVTELANKGMEHALAGEYALAEQCWTEALRLEPQEVKLWVFRAMARGMLGNLAGAEADALESLRRDPLEAQIWRSRADDSLGNNRFQDAITQATEALKINPEDHKALYMRAYAYAKVDRFNDSLQDLNKSIEIKPIHNPSYTVRCHLLCNMGRKEEGMQDYQKALARDRGSVGTLWLQARLAFDDTDWKSVIVVTEKIKKLQVLDGIDFVLYGVALLKVHRYGEALAAFQRALSDDLVDDVSMEWRGQINCYCASILVETRVDEAFKYLDQAWKLGKRDAEFHRWRAYAYESIKKYSEAIADYHKAILLSPKDVTIRIALIEALTKSQRWEDARDELLWLSKTHFEQEESAEYKGWIEERQATVAREIDFKKKGSSSFTQSSLFDK